MAKWFGKIGYAVTSETRPGIWEEVIVERNYYGDMTRIVEDSKQRVRLMMILISITNLVLSLIHTP